MSVKVKKSWTEKLHDSKGLPKFGKVEGKMTKKWGTGTMVIPAPIDVDEMMQCVPKGKVTTINQLRAALAKKYKVNICCPITTGIFASIAAHAAVEADAAGKKCITPWWRTLKSTGELNPKYPGGLEAQMKLLKAEGHVIKAGKGQKPPRVQDFEKVLQK